MRKSPSFRRRSSVLTGPVSLARMGALGATLVCASVFGCSAGAPGSGGDGDGSDSADSGTDSTDAVGTGGSNNTDLGADLGADLGSTGGSGGDCIKLATWGALGTYGAVPGMDGQDAITAWLNENSTGEAEYFATKPALTADVLATYQVIILQNLNGWTFTADEKAAFEAWCEQVAASCRWLATATSQRRPRRRTTSWRSRACRTWAFRGRATSRPQPSRRVPTASATRTRRAAGMQRTPFLQIFLRLARSGDAPSARVLVLPWPRGTASALAPP